jgi:hypothetical protein
MKTSLLFTLALTLLPSCTTNQQLNDKIIDVGFDLVTLGLTQNAPPVELPPVTVSK